MKSLDKSLIISALAALALLPLLAAANTPSSALVPPDSAKQPATKLQLGRDLHQEARRSQCVEWKTRCYKRKFCQPYYKYPCFVCRKYKGYGEYKYRKTCDFNSMQGYRMKGYWCYRFKKHTAGRCEYFYKKYCKRYCYKRVYH